MTIRKLSRAGLAMFAAAITLSVVQDGPAAVAVQEWIKSLFERESAA